MEEYLSWYISNGVGDLITIRPTYRWSGTKLLNKKVFKKLKGYDNKNLPTNEDMYIAYKLITNGYRIKYCADSIVEHSHKFTFKQLYKRYYDTGIFFKQNSYLNDYNHFWNHICYHFYMMMNKHENFHHIDHYTVF